MATMVWGQTTPGLEGPGLSPGGPAAGPGLLRSVPGSQLLYSLNYTPSGQECGLGSVSHFSAE